MTDEVQDVATDTNVEVDEATNSNENSEQEDAVALQEKLDQAEKAKSQLTARAKKAEEELKALKAKPQESKLNDPQLSDELKLIARGLSDEEIEQAKIIAKGKSIALTEAIKDPLFTIFQDDFKEKERKEKAKLGASKGSGETEPEVKGFQSGASEEEHKKAFQKAVGKK
jgi:hypothetical protein